MSVYLLYYSTDISVKQLSTHILVIGAPGTEYSWLRRGETQDKGWLNQLQEEPGLRWQASNRDKATKQN